MDVRGVVVEFPSGVKLRLGALSVEDAAVLLRELRDAPPSALPSVADVEAFLVREACVAPIKTSQVHERLLGRRYLSRGADKATYNAISYRLERAREAIDAAGEWACVVAPAVDESGETTWFLCARRP